MLPLASHGETVGVLEVLAEEPRIDDAWDLLESYASQLGVALRAVTQNARLRRELESAEQAASLGASMVRAGTADEAVRVAVRLVRARFRVPVVGWYGSGGGMLRLIELHGIGARGRREFGEEMSTLPAWASLGPPARESVKRRFRELTGSRRVSALSVGDALLLAGGPSASIEGALEVAGSLLAEVLRLLDTAALADLRNQRLDLGIAWTAHEIRGPLLGVRAALDLLLERSTSDPAERSVLQSSLHELDQLTASAEAILTWAVGERHLDLREADLVWIVEEAVASCRLEMEQGKHVVVFAPERAVARFDPTHLRTVVTNLVRNALAYSYQGTKVEVVVEDAGDHLALSVKDEGPEIPVEERRLIFDPFMRGSVPGATRNGAGLGLFIARRVV
ncbi:MAG TPA: HAMP domain-containing sensor histidine kinase, partial [Actinomycetota bacterium]